jgi:hypothetical protein
VASGGYDQHQPREAIAPHHVHIPPALLYKLLPWLQEEERVVAKAVHEAKGVRGKMAACRLHAAQGSLNGHRLAFTTAVPAPEPIPENGKRRKNRHLTTASGEVAMVFLSQHADVKSLWREFKHGVNGTKPLCQLEKDHGSSWRNTGTGKRFSEQGPLYRFIEGQIKAGRSEDDALRDLQVQLDEVGSRGASKAPNWYALLKRLRESPAESDRPWKIARRQNPNYNSAERNAVALTGGDEVPIHLMPDGEIRPDDGPGVIVTLDTYKV